MSQGGRQPSCAAIAHPLLIDGRLRPRSGRSDTRVDCPDASRWAAQHCCARIDPCERPTGKSGSSGRGFRVPMRVMTTLFAVLLSASVNDAGAQSAPQRASATAGTLHVGGHDLGYRIEGRGPTTLIVGSAIFYSRAFSAGLRRHLPVAILARHPGTIDAPSSQ
jgi:hypothetical protein